MSAPLYKVLRGGESWHGGTRRWSLPTLADDGTWTPGEWTPAVTPVLCETGWHLTREPARWWGAGDVAAYLTQTDGAVTRYDDGGAKCAVERCRLLRPLTRDELAALGVCTEGEHEARSGIAHVSGSATVTAYGSATVRAYDSATVTAYDSARAHAAGQSVCTAWRGTSLVLTRSDRGVIVDRRGANPVIYAKRRGVDGWRYDEDSKTWSQRKARVTP